ncbi:ABC transporter substrate-binding protein [Micromonospora purpureochromogenes]|uniref:ABC transporter substrate-binding protein n=1 Tax=Micromonospora purpureochromogenes TaxID=47872 RepID=UPI00341043D4
MTPSGRAILRLAAATLTVGLALTGCGGAEKPAPADPAEQKPRAGGTLRVGALGKVAAISRDPHGVLSNESDFLITSLVYDALTVPGEQANVAPRLATEWKPSEDLTTWRFTIADNATFHDGTPVTSDDVVWSLKRLRDTPSGASRLPGVDSAGISADGPKTVVLKSNYANSELPLLARLMTFVLKKGTTTVEGSPGTGPFRLESYQNGNAVLKRNPKWHGGDVYLDTVEVRMFESPQALTNALISGQVDLASNVGAVAARVAERNKNVQIVRRPNDTSMPIVMRAADGPFADPKVREALKLAVDREAMVNQVLSGYGTVANDVLGTGDQHYDTSLPQRKRDLERAKQLLSEAKFDTSKTYDLVTTEDIPGLAESATLFATQVRDAGVNIKVVKQESGQFWEKTWLNAPLYTTYWGTNDSVVFFAGKTMNSEAKHNEAAWRDPEFDAAYKAAVSTTDEAARKPLLAQLQKIEYERSGYLLWGMADGVDLAAAQVRGLPKLGGYGRVQLERVWLAS